MSTEPPPPPRLSADGKFYWDGSRWVATLLDDQRWRWDGTKWTPAEAAAARGGELVQQPASTSVFVYGPRTNGLAVGALIAGVGAWILCPLIAATVAVVLGHIARSQIKRTGAGGSGMAMAGLILGYIQIGVATIFMVVFVIFPGILILITPTTHH